MSKAKLVFLHGLNQQIVDLICAYAPADISVAAIEGQLSEDAQIAAVRDADFLMVYRAELKDAVLKAAPRLKLVQLLAAGYEKINLELMRELKIPCANNAGANSWAVADHAVLLMLALYRRLVQVDRSTREGRWRAPLTGLNTFEMADKLVGILGIGNIGSKVAQRVQAFGARVQYFDKFPLSRDREQQLNVTLVPLDQLIRTSDILTCHAPLTPETHHLFNEARLAQMKPGAILINTSRGTVIDEGALVQALRDGKIMGAGLDVFEKEPVDPSNPLLAMDNVVVTPHGAGTTRDTWRRRAEFAFANMNRILSGQEPMAVIQG